MKTEEKLIMFKSKFTVIIGLIVVATVDYFVGYQDGALNRDPAGITTAHAQELVSPVKARS